MSQICLKIRPIIVIFDSKASLVVNHGYLNGTTRTSECCIRLWRSNSVFCRRIFHKSEGLIHVQHKLVFMPYMYYLNSRNKAKLKGTNFLFFHKTNSIQPMLYSLRDHIAVDHTKRSIKNSMI